ncbi:hypothetical protein NDU88_000710 [Pleurodeles waltl]|uniref:Uncharacterized protein n=1 Tax=Pleurodeles waltl TaxID=8319 RepID=A0AAV7N8P6_PLEWA|nr:hypothetical protein NDU88_000710 [Pleurodeles waltl]
MVPMSYSLGGFPAQYQQSPFLPVMPMALLPWPLPAPRKVSPSPTTDTQKRSSLQMVHALASEGSMPASHPSTPVLVDLTAPVSKSLFPKPVSPAPI